MKVTRYSIGATFVGFLVVFFSFAPSFALEVPLRPTDVPIVDQTNTLTNDQKNALARQIANERQTSGNQLAVLIVPTLDGDALEDFSLNVARQWGIGTSENDNGALLLVVKDDRLLRIEVGYGLEGALTDVQSNRIIQNEVTPYFRQDKYYEGVRAGLTGIIAAIRGEYTATANADSGSLSFPWEGLLFFGFIAASWLGSMLSRTKSWWAGGVIGGFAGGLLGLFLGSLLFGIVGVVILTFLGLFLDKIVSDNYRSHARQGDKPSWWAGGGVIGGGGGSNGGFGGFGGGGFGGGGSSGSW